MSYPNGAKFTPPQAATLPAFLPETKGPEFGLAKYRNVMNQGVTVYALSDGTFVQDIPTAENGNTNIPPYPLSSDNATGTPNILDVTYATVPTTQIGTVGNTTTVAIPGTTANGFCLARITTTVSPYVTTVYQGGRTFKVTQSVATALAAFTAHGTGYAADLVAL